MNIFFCFKFLLHHLLFFENILLQAWKYSNVNKLKAFGCLYFIKPTMSRESNITQHASNQSNDNEEFGAAPSA